MIMKTAEAMQQRHPAAVRDLQRVGAEEREVDDEERDAAAPAARRFQPQTCRATTYASMVVIAIVAVTAMP